MKHARQKFKIYELAILKTFSLNRMRILKEISKWDNTYSSNIAETLNLTTPQVAFHLNGNINQDKLGLFELGMVEEAEKYESDLESMKRLKVTEFGQYVVDSLYYDMTFEDWK